MSNTGTAPSYRNHDDRSSDTQPITTRLSVRPTPACRRPALLVPLTIGFSTAAAVRRPADSMGVELVQV